MPEPPLVADQVGKSDLIVRAVLLHTHSYRVAGKLKHQARFRVLDTLRASRFYPLNEGDEFSVLYGMKPEVYGPHFMEEPEPGEYIVLLELLNVSLQGRVVGQDVRFIFPNPYALYEPSAEVLSVVGAKR